MSKLSEKYASFTFVEVPCPLCGSEQHVPERVVDGFQFVKCSACTMVYVCPQLDAEGLRKIYQDKKDVEQIINIYASLATPTVLAEYDAKLTQLERVLGRKGKILDFACAAAYFVERAAARGWEAHGTDIGPWAKEAARRRGVENVHIGEITKLGFEPRSFDVIFAAQVLEHLQQPLTTLAELRSLLKPDGLLYVDVPNYQTLPIMMNRDQFYLNAPPQHINFFTPRTLRQCLKTAGFDVRYISTEGGINWENLVGKPIISEISDAYRANDAGGKKEERHSATTVARQPSQIKRAVKILGGRLVYDRLKVGINLVTISRLAA